MMMITVVSLVVLACAASSNAYSYVGCFEDKSSRILTGQSTTDSAMTVEKCVQFCSLAGEYFAGVEYATQCYCGKNLKQYASLAQSQCSTNCGGDSSQKCGGTWKISVYTTNTHYLGCYEDKSTRILEGAVMSNPQMTTKMCIEHCQSQGKRFALTEYSSQCFCGNHLKTYAKKPEGDCSYNCGGNANEKCGGFWRGSLYLINYNSI